MKFNKQKIQQRFSLASTSYEDVSMVQREAAQFLIKFFVEVFPNFHPTSILDLGTGTGYIPEILLPIFPSSHYTLNDISVEMLNITRKKFFSSSQFDFHLGDIENSNFLFHDLIISSFALQWVDLLNLTLQKLYFNSEVLAFSCLLKGTFGEWEEITEMHEVPSAVSKYPTQDKLKEFLLSLNPAGCFFRIKDYPIAFPNIKAFIKYLKNLGASAGSKEIPLNKLKNLINTYNQELNLTYKVFFGVLKREK